MAQMKNMQTGEMEEVSLEEVMDALRSGEGSVQQQVRHADGTVTTSTIYGNNMVDGIDRSVNVFGTIQDLLGYCINKEVLKEKDGEKCFVMDNSEDEFEVIIDDTSMPLMHIVTYTKENVRVARYIRDERKTVGEPISVETFLFEQGKITVTAEEAQKNNIIMFGFAMYELRKILRAEGLLEEMQEIGNKGSGLMIVEKGDGYDVRIVKGHGRPDLPCMMFGGLFAESLDEAIMMRPYIDELMEEACYEGMSLEEKIQEAESGNAMAMEDLALLYVEGDEVPRDFSKAVYWMEKADENGMEISMDLLELCKKAIEAEKNVKSGDAQAQADLANVYMNLGNMLYNSEDYKRSFEYAQKSAAQDNCEGLWLLALAYENGRGVEEDPLKAIEFYRRAADLGHAPSQNNLACYYMRGDYLDVDHEKAFELFEKSAVQGYKLAEFSLCKMYEYGNGTEENLDKAIEWGEKAANGGTADVQYEVAQLYTYTNDDGKMIDPERAKYWYSQAAEKGHEMAQGILRFAPMWDEGEEDTDEEDEMEWTLEEKVYDYITEQTEPKSIGEIHKEFPEMSRRELARLLQALAGEGEMYRSLKEGKAYYSVEEEEGTAKNPVQQGIADMQKKLQGAFGESAEEKAFGELKESFDELSQLLDDLDEDEDEIAFGEVKEGLDLLSQLLNDEDDFDETIDVSEIQLTYQENKEVVCDDYTMKIPDGFEIIEEEGRDFVAYLKNEKLDEDWEMGGAHITILPSYVTPIGDEYNFHLPETYGALYEVYYWNGTKRAFEMMGGETKFFPVVVDTTGGGCVHMSMMENSHHYYIMYYKGEGFKQIHIQIDNIRGEENEIRKVIEKLAEGFVLKKPLERLDKLNAPEFLSKKADQQMAKEWKELFEKTTSEIQILFDLKNSAVVQKRIEYEQSQGLFSSLKLIKRLREGLKEHAKYIDDMLVQVKEFMGAQIKLNPQNQTILEFYEIIKAYVEEFETISITLDDEKLVEHPAQISEIVQILNSAEIQALKEARKEEERKQRAREEEERKRIEQEEKERRRVEEEQRKQKEAEEKAKKAIISEKIAKKRKSNEKARNIIFGGSDTYGVVTPEGTVLLYGMHDEKINKDVSSWRNIVSIAVGQQHVVGLRRDGTVVATKGGSLYDFGHCNVSGWRNIVSIAAGFNHTVGLRKDGTVVAVGNNRDGSCEVSSWKDIVEIATGNGSTIGRTSEGKVVATGDISNPVEVYGVERANKGRDCLEYKKWPPVVAIAAERDYVYGITKEGDLVSTCYIQNLEEFTNIVTISAGKAGNEVLVGVRLDGTVVGYWGSGIKNHSVKSLKNIVYAVDKSGYFSTVTLALKEDGTLVTSPMDALSAELKSLKFSFKLEYEYTDQIVASKRAIQLYEKEIEEHEKQISLKHERLQEVKGIFAGMKKKSIQAEIERLEEKLSAKRTQLEIERKKLIEAEEKLKELSE